MRPKARFHVPLRVEHSTKCAPRTGAGLFGTLGPVTRQAQAAAQAERLAAEVRLHFRLPADTVVLASELECSLPGCPPLETVIAFWTGNAQRHHCKVFKPLQQVSTDDLPPWWMKDALAALPDWACDCC